MSIRYYTARSGEVAFESGHLFRFMIQGDRIPEVYGWIERDHAISHPGGFWRTDDPMKAARLAADLHGLKIVEA